MPWRPLERTSRALVRLSPVVGFAVAAWVGIVAWSPQGPNLGEEISAEAVRAELNVELPLEMNEWVERWLHRFTTDQRQTFESFLSREGLYAGMIREKLRARGMPEDLVYLAMIESGFSASARSPASATGVWQFMGPTAREYGLRIDSWVDERRDPVQATDAALDYLEELHERFGSWYLAAAGYNAGPNRVARVLRRHGEVERGDEELYWEIIDHLPRETREYVPKLLAATYLAKKHAEFSLEVGSSEPYAYDRVWVPGGTSLSAVAEAVGSSTGIVKDLNPHLIRSVTPPGESYPVRVPPGTGASVVAALAGR